MKISSNQHYLPKLVLKTIFVNFFCLHETLDFDVAAKFAELLGGMGLALITTFYGVLFANLIFLPIGGKLKRKSEDELMMKNIIVEGIISLHSKEHPILIREKLMTFIPSNLRTE